MSPREKPQTAAGRSCRCAGPCICFSRSSGDRWYSESRREHRSTAWQRLRPGGLDADGARAGELAHHEQATRLLLCAAAAGVPRAARVAAPPWRARPDADAPLVLRSRPLSAPVLVPPPLAAPRAGLLLYRRCHSLLSCCAVKQTPPYCISTQPPLFPALRFFASLSQGSAGLGIPAAPLDIASWPPAHPACCAAVCARLCFSLRRCSHIHFYSCTASRRRRTRPGVWASPATLEPLWRVDLLRAAATQPSLRPHPPRRSRPDAACLPQAHATHTHRARRHAPQRPWRPQTARRRRRRTRPASPSRASPSATTSSSTSMVSGRCGNSAVRCSSLTKQHSSACPCLCPLRLPCPADHIYITAPWAPGAGEPFLVVRVHGSAQCATLLTMSLLPLSLSFSCVCRVASRLRPSVPCSDAPYCAVPPGPRCHAPLCCSALLRRTRLSRAILRRPMRLFCCASPCLGLGTCAPRHAALLVRRTRPSAARRHSPHVAGWRLLIVHPASHPRHRPYHSRHGP
jgi:hypothetical protein